METYRRIEGLVDYIAEKYTSTVEIGIGNFPDVAYALLKRRVHVVATDIHRLWHKGLKVIVDDVTQPDFNIYKRAALLYAMRPPAELIPYMKNIARIVYADLIVKPLSSEYIIGGLIRYRDTTFYFWEYSNRHKKYVV